ncbi:Ribokinase-like protein [Cytidiella melzeri]|nr:Ribokinase-like protein [Cytidiella melzeri]
MSPRPICLVRGSINIDEFFHVPAVVRPGETLSSSRFERRAGGKGANQAVAVARAGGKVNLVGAVGSDGDWVLQDLTHLGVDTSKVLVTVEEPTGRAIIQLTPQGENSIILHRGANYHLSASPVSDRPEDQEYTHLLLQNEIPYQVTLAYLSHSYRTQKTSFFNPSPLPTGDQIKAFPWEQLDWLIVNEGEALDLLRVIGEPPTRNPAQSGRTTDNEEGEMLSSTRQVLRNLHTHPSFSGTVNVICTLGASGVLALVPHLLSDGEDEIMHVPALKLDPAAVKDTTGAGDCFAGYFVAELMQLSNYATGAPAAQNAVSRQDVIQTLERCVNAAGLCVQRLGAMESIPSRCDVDTHMRVRNVSS